MSTQRKSANGKPLRGYENSLPIALLRTREAVMARFRPHLASHDVTEQQWRAIRALAEYEAVDATTLSEICCVMMPSLSRILKTLESDGVISRIKSDDDGRRQVIKLTAKGRKMFDEMSPRSAQIYAEIEQEVGREEIDAIVSKLRQLQSRLNPSSE